MSRPSPIVYLQRNVSDTVLEQICAGQDGAVYCILYRGAPVLIKRIRVDRNDGTAKYVRTAWSHWGHANRLVLALNRIYATTDFTVGVLRP